MNEQNGRATLLGLLADEQAAEALRAQVCQPQSREQFIEVYTGSVAHPAQLWDVAEGIAHLQAMPVCGAELLGLPQNAWHHTPPTLAQCIEDIVVSTTADSPLATSMRRRAAEGNFIRPYIDEVIAGFARDGVMLDYDQLRPLVRGQRIVASAADAAFMNAYRVMSEMAQQATHALDVAGLQALNARLAEGCDTLGVPTTAPAPTSLTARATEQLTCLLDAAPKSKQQALYAIISASAIIWQCKPFAQFNGVMEVIVRMNLCLRAGMPALSCVPYAQYDLQLAASPGGGGAVARMAWDSPFGVDCTPYFAARIKDLQRGVHELQRSLAQLDQRDDGIALALEDDFRLNHRQRATMVRAASEVRFGIDVAGYCKEHGVAVATARADLQRLVALDYLYRDHEGARIVYRVRPDLQGKVEAFANKGR